MFMSSDLNNILRQIEEESKSNDKCLISRLDVTQNNGITLSCGHKYRVNYLKKNKYSKCPYCARPYSLSNYEKQCTTCSKPTFFDSGLCSKHAKVKCQHILKNKKQCKNGCKDNNKFCHIHL